MSTRIFDPNNVLEQPTDQAFDAGWHTLGVEMHVSEPATMVGGSAWWPTTDPANFLWLVYRIADEQIMAEVNLATAVSSPVNEAWNDFDDSVFTIPPGGSADLDPDETEGYALVYATNGDFTFRNTSVSYPYTEGIPSAVASRFHNGGSGAVFPTGTNTTDLFPVDVFVEAASSGVAVTGSAVAGFGALLTATKRAHVAGSATIIDLSTLTAAKRAHVAGVGQAAVAAIASTEKRIPAAGVALAGVGATVAAVKRVAVTGVCSIGATTTMSDAQVPGSSQSAVSAQYSSTSAVSANFTSSSSVSGG